MRRAVTLVPLLLALLAPVARAEEPAGSAAKVHDHVAYTFRAPLGPRTPVQRAADASQNLAAVIDEDVLGEIRVVPNGNAAEVMVGDRLLFRLGEDDAHADGSASLAEYAPRIQSQLQGFLAKERQRAHLQKSVLGVSLAVFFSVVVYVLLGAFFRATRRYEEKLERGEARPLPEPMRRLGLEADSEGSRGALLFGLSALRIIVSVGALYLLLLASLSLFEVTRPFRDRLALWAAAPFRALGARLVVGLPNLLLLLVLLGVLRGGWRAMTVGFERMAMREDGGKLLAHQVIPYRLIARAALVIGALMLLPLVLGGEVGLFSVIGLVLLGVIGVGALPLLANVVVGVYVLLTNQYAPGEWLCVRLASGAKVNGEVTSVDFFHLRMVPESGGEVRLPHLITLWSAVDHLPSSRALTVEFPVPRTAMTPRDALTALDEAAQRIAHAQNLESTPSVELLGVTADQLLFRVALPEGSEMARTQLLLALEDAVRSGRGGA